MSTVPIRQLNQDTAGVLARVKRGEAIDITERGVVIARLVPSRPHPLAELIAAGRVKPPTATGRLPHLTGPVHDDDDEAGRLVRAMRDDERY
ncbi:MAG: type II toxin-antitoxin system Phd/YefM family antitoxin [Phycicoccus sp.]